MSQPPARRTTHEIARELSERSREAIEVLRDVAFEERQAKTLERRWPLNATAALVGRDAGWISREERAGHLPAAELGENGRRLGYTLPQINALRDALHTNPYRLPGDPVTRLAFSNFKGGVCKTTLSVHAAQYFAMRGYRVLLVDADSQASATMLFGLRPDVDVDGEETLLPFLSGDVDSLRPVVRATHWDRLDLIPAALDLYSAEYGLTAEIAQHGGHLLDRLHLGLEEIEENYDIIILDPPPSLGMISLSVLRAVSGLVVPVPPAMVDFHSTAAFFQMLVDVVGDMNGENGLAWATGRDLEVDFLKVLVTKHDAQRAAGDFIKGLMDEFYTDYMMYNTLLQSAEFENAASSLQTVYEQSGKTTSRDTYRRCVRSLDSVFGEIEALVTAGWRSRETRPAVGSEPVVTRVPARPIVVPVDVRESSGDAGS